MERKHFLKLTALSASSLLIGNATALSFFDAEPSKKRLKKFGIQLWSVRDFMFKDAKGTIKDLAGYGYNLIESCDLGKGIFWGMTPQEFKSFITDNGIDMKTAHCNMSENFEKLADNAKSIGMEQLIYPWEGPNKTIDDYKKLAEDFNKKGEYLKKMGMKISFHNHDYTFRKLEGQFAQDVLMQNTQVDLVDYELDMYWVVTAGQDPIEWLKKYPNRFTGCHIKDRIKTADDKETNASCVLGTGKINYAKILPVAKKLGMKYFYVEHERYDEGTSMQCVKMDAEYMKKLKV